MKTHAFHAEILALIRQHSGTPTQHTFLDSYLGNDHPRYPINVPTLRKIAREWMKAHSDLGTDGFQKMIDSLIRGQSSTEKCMAGILLDFSSRPQRKFDARVFDQWLDHLEGWAEIDAVCTGAYSLTEIPGQWVTWKKLLVKFSRSRNINKRRASLVWFCSPLRKAKNVPMVTLALENIERLKSEEEILITKAISWVLRCAAVHHKDLVKKYLALNKDTLPKIALRETWTKLKTGRKTKPKR